LRTADALRALIGRLARRHRPSDLWDADRVARFKVRGGFARKEISSLIRRQVRASDGVGAAILDDVVI